MGHGHCDIPKKDIVFKDRMFLDVKDLAKGDISHLLGVFAALSAGLFSESGRSIT